MILLRAIDEIIKTEPFKVAVKDNSYILEELKKEDYPLTVIKVKKKHEALAYQFDFERSHVNIFPFFNEKIEGLTKMCDYIIFYPYKGRMYVFMCELKTRQVKGSAGQVQAAKLFAAYIIGMAKRHLKDFKDFDIQYRALIFSTSNTRRFSTNVRNEPYSQYRTGLKFKHLRAGEVYRLNMYCD